VQKNQIQAQVRTQILEAIVIVRLEVVVVAAQTRLPLLVQHGGDVCPDVTALHELCFCFLYYINV
jgi:hypothetical protein